MLKVIQNYLMFLVNQFNPHPVCRVRTDPWKHCQVRIWLLSSKGRYLRWLPNGIVRFWYDPLKSIYGIELLHVSSIGFKGVSNQYGKFRENLSPKPSLGSHLNNCKHTWQSFLGSAQTPHTGVRVKVRLQCLAIYLTYQDWLHGNFFRSVLLKIHSSNKQIKSSGNWRLSESYFMNKRYTFVYLLLLLLYFITKDPNLMANTPLPWCQSRPAVLAKNVSCILTNKYQNSVCNAFQPFNIW